MVVSLSYWESVISDKMGYINYFWRFQYLLKRHGFNANIKVVTNKASVHQVTSCIGSSLYWSHSIKESSRLFYYTRHCLYPVNQTNKDIQWFFLYLFAPFPFSIKRAFASLYLMYFWCEKILILVGNCINKDTKGLSLHNSENVPLLCEINMQHPISWKNWDREKK